jgi:hypothetical protein
VLADRPIVSPGRPIHINRATGRTADLGFLNLPIPRSKLKTLEKWRNGEIKKKGTYKEGNTEKLRVAKPYTSWDRKNSLVVTEARSHPTIYYFIGHYEYI